jgi:hypothetical protein
MKNFSFSTGLKVDYSKTSMSPINIGSKRCSYLANTFACKAESLSFAYQGLPMGITKPRIEHFISIAGRIDSRFSRIASTLSYDVRFIVGKTIFMSMLNCAMCTLKVKGSARGFS